jgi:mannose-6-phosphate isomerase-like protein (cupin superfamily)
MFSPIKTYKPQRAEILARVARFDEIVGSTGGTVDADYPGCQRTLYNAIGFADPAKELLNPIGTARPALNLAEGYGFGFASMRPGNGPMMHTHDTVETFIIFEGRWRIEWEGAEGIESVEIGPRDIISFPPGVQRRFECIEAPPGKAEGLISTVIMGNAPGVALAPDAIRKLVAAGKVPASALPEEAADQAA